MASKAAQLLSFMDALGLESATIAAHSHGGAVAMTFASMWPERIRGLVLVAPANPYSHASDGIRFYGSSFGRTFAKCVPWLPRQILRIALQRMYGDPKRIQADVLGGYVECLQIPGTVNHVMKIITTWSADMKLLRSAIKAGAMKGKHVLMVWGDRDIVVPVESGRLLHQQLNGASMVVLPGVGHIPVEELPEQCNRILLEWAQAQGLTEKPPRPDRTIRTLSTQTA
jgi:pimeloyl-ACP methyl ester carboxylesterase